jgi:hypothetical protein
MVRVLRVSSMPFDMLLWCRPVVSGHVMYESEQLLDHGAVSPWKTD